MPSLMSSIIKAGFRLKGVKKSYQTDVLDIARMRSRNIDAKDPMIQKMGYQLETYHKHSTYLYPKKSKRLIIWLHPGAYSLGPFKQDFTFLKKICEKTQCDGLVLDYPKAPEFTYKDTLLWVEEAIKNYLPKYQEYFMMGASAGGGLTLGLAYKLHEQEERMPSQIFTLSPWIDLTCSINSEKCEKLDPFLSMKGLKIFAENYAKGNLSLPYVSPFFGEFEQWSIPTSIYMGTHEVLYPTIKEFSKRCSTQIKFKIFPEMIHCWPLMPCPEASLVHKEIIQSIS